MLCIGDKKLINLKVNCGLKIYVGETPCYLLVGELLSEVGHDVSQLGGGDETVAILVEHTEGLPDLLFAVEGRYGDCFESTIQ